MTFKHRKSKVKSKHRKSKVKSKRRKSKVKSKRRKSKVKSKRKKSKVTSKRRKSHKFMTKHKYNCDLTKFNKRSNASPWNLSQGDLRGRLKDPLLAYLFKKSYSLDELVNCEVGAISFISLLGARGRFKPLKIEGCGNSIIWDNREKIDLLKTLIESNILINVREISLPLEITRNSCHAYVEAILPYFSRQYLPHLQILELTNVNFKTNASGYNTTTLLFKIASLNTLTRLTLNNNNIAAIPPSLRNLTNLTFLDISNNSIGNSGLQTIVDNLPNLEVLKVNNCGITQLPANFHDLLNLREFSLSQEEHDKFLEEFW